MTARRLFWGKSINCGQVCLSPDYAIVPSSKEEEFIQAVKETFKEWYPQGMQKSPDLTRLVNERHFNRIKKMLDESKGEVKVGGNTDENDKYIDLTLIKVPGAEDSLLKDEIFGPVLPYVVIDELDDAIAFINKVSDTPLALYAFTTDRKEQETILKNTRSGGATINDSIWHATSCMMPFGGVGESGHGNYRGKASFDNFSHRRTTAIQAGRWMEKLLDVRYPPYTSGKLSQYMLLMDKTPNFSRDGKARSSWVSWFASLGGGETKTVVAKSSVSQESG